MTDGFKKIAFLVGIAFLVPISVNAFSISPPIFELDGVRSEVIESSISIFNTGETSETYHISKIAFEAGEESGAPVFHEPDSENAGFLDWISFPINELVVNSRTKVDVPFIINIPKDVPSGSYYGAIGISVAPSEIVETNGMSINTATAILVFLTIEGDTVENLKLMDFQIDKSESLSSFAGDYQYRLQNQGNVFENPVSMIELTDIFGRSIYSIDANTQKGRVLPGSTRKYSTQIYPINGFFGKVKEQLSKFVIGPVTANLSIVYGQQQEVISEKIVFWVIPWQLFLTVFSVIILSSFIYWGFYKLSKKRNRK